MLDFILVYSIAIGLKLANQVKGAPDVTEIAHLDCSNSNRKLILTVMLNNKKKFGTLFFRKKELGLYFLNKTIFSLHFNTTGQRQFDVEFYEESFDA